MTQLFRVVSTNSVWSDGEIDRRDVVVGRAAFAVNGRKSIYSLPPISPSREKVGRAAAMLRGKKVIGILLARGDIDGHGGCGQSTWHGLHC